MTGLLFDTLSGREAVQLMRTRLGWVLAPKKSHRVSVYECCGPFSQSESVIPAISAADS